MAASERHERPGMFAHRQTGVELWVMPTRLGRPYLEDGSHEVYVRGRHTHVFQTSMPHYVPCHLSLLFNRAFAQQCDRGVLGRSWRR